MPVVMIRIPQGDIALSGDPTSASVWTASGSYVLIEGIEQIRQRLACRIQFFLGEWFIDLRQGIPYFRPGYLGKSPNPSLIRSMMRRVILQTPGVRSVEKLELRIDSTSRRGQLLFQAICDGGVIVVKEGDKDFLLDFASAA